MVAKEIGIFGWNLQVSSLSHLLNELTDGRCVCWILLLVIGMIRAQKTIIIRILIITIIIF